MVTERRREAAARSGAADERRAAGPDGRGWTGSVALVLATSTGGIGRHVASLAGGLPAAGVSVTVYGPAATQERFDFTGRGARFVPVDIPASLHLGDLRAVAALRRAWRESPPQVVHAHGFRAGFVAARARGPYPLVVTWHNAPLARGLRAYAYRFAEGYIARAADVTLGASADLVARAADLGARDARLGAVAAPTLPPPARSRAAVRAELGLTRNIPMVLSVGRLHPQKGYGTLVEAAARLGQGVAVVIAGTGPSYLDLVAHISAARAPVILLGHRNDVADLLGAADIAVVTSVWEARQLFAQEALRAGTPLVATAVGGIPGLVGDAALLVPAGNVDALEAAVRRLLADLALREELAARGRAQAQTWPSEKETIAEVLGVYAELAAPRGKPGPPDGTGGPGGGR